MIILISILIAFLLLCLITYIDFQIWYKKQKEGEKEYPLYICGVDIANPVQIFTGAISIISQKVSGNINISKDIMAGSIIKANGMDEIKILQEG